jgi:hypothetical protein
LAGPSTAPSPSGGQNLAAVNSAGQLNTHNTSGGYIILTSSSSTACTSLAAGAFGTIVLDNVGAGNGAIYPQFYDEATAACSAADLIYGDGTSVYLGPAQIVALWQGVKNGVSIKLSASLVTNLEVAW